MQTFLRTTIAVLGLAAAYAWAQVAAEANKAYQTPEGRQGLIKTLSSAEREQREKPQELVARLGIRPGSTVADVGTGTGMMLPYLAEAVGPSGRLIAEDIREDFLEQAKSRAKAKNLTNVTFVLGNDRSPNLPAGQVDLVFTLDVYHHFDYPPEMLGHIAKALKPDGRLAIADFYRTKRGPQDKDQSKHVRADKDEVIREVEANGFQLVSNEDHLSNQYVLLFRKK